MKTVFGILLLAAALIIFVDKSSTPVHYVTQDNPNTKIEIEHKYATTGNLELQNTTGW